MVGLTIDENTGGTTIVSTQASREKMLPDIPPALRVLERHDATDLAEMLLGEDA